MSVDAPDLLPALSRALASQLQPQATQHGPSLLARALVLYGRAPEEARARDRAVVAGLCTSLAPRVLTLSEPDVALLVRAGSTLEVVRTRLLKELPAAAAAAAAGAAELDAMATQGVKDSPKA